MPKQTEKRKAYQREYRRIYMRQKSINFNLANVDDVELMKWLEAQEEGISAYLRRLIRKDKMRREMINAESKERIALEPWTAPKNS